MTALATRVGTIRLSLATIAVTALIPLAPWLATTERVTRSEWRRAQSGLAAVTWTGVSGLRHGISSACNGFSLRRGSVAATRTQPWRLISLTTPGIVRRRKVVRSTHYKPPLTHSLLLAS